MPPAPHPHHPAARARTHRVRPWRWLGTALLAWPLGLAVGVQAQVIEAPPIGGANLPALGDAAAQDLSPMAERRLGDRIMRSILRDPDVVDDPLVLEYLNQIWRSLLSSARRRGEISADIDATHAWTPFLVRERSINAFALPGGYIGVHFGLLAMTTSPDELASVLAHEMSHVTQRHIARMIAQESRTSWMSVASMLLGILAASRNPAAGQAMIYGGQAVTLQGQLNFSRDMEREADRIGFGVLSDAGFEPAGMALMFEHLQQASRLNDDGSFPYLRTHPLTTERIGEARARMGPSGWDRAAQAGHPQSALWAWHALMSARSRVLMDTRSEALQALVHLEAHADDTPLKRLAARYTSAVAAQRAGEPARAATALQQARQLVKALPSAQQAMAERVLALSEAEGLLDARRPQDAAKVLAQMPAPPEGLPAAHRPELLMAARVALATPDAKGPQGAWAEASARLQTHLSQFPQDATAWASLSGLWQAQGQALRAVRADAEATAALGDLPGAIERLQGAQKRFRQPDAADVIELSVMDARLKAWQRQQREDLRDEAR